MVTPVGDSSADTQRGFTLIELIITMAVLAVVVGVAFPSFQSMLAEQRVKAASEGLAMSILYARSEAIKRRAAVDVSQLDSSWSNGWEVKQGTNVLRKDNMSGVTITGVSSSSLSLNRNGRLSSTFSFAICDYAGKAIKRVLAVSIGGQTRVSKGGSCTE